MGYTIENIVIIDDSDYKRDAVARYMQHIIPDAEIHQFDCVAPAMKYLAVDRCKDIEQNGDSWLVITDMYMPIRRGGSIERTAGKRVLRELHRLEFACPVIAESSDPLDNEELEHYYRGFIGSVLEDSSVCNEYKYEELLEDYKM